MSSRRGVVIVEEDLHDRPMEHDMRGHVQHSRPVARIGMPLKKMASVTTWTTQTRTKSSRTSM